MQVNFQEELQKAIEKTKSIISQDDIKFVKENYKYEKIQNGYQYIFYAWRLHQTSESTRTRVKNLIKHQIGYYSSQSGHTIPSHLID